ncbi:MAG: hypothetical protein HQL55_12745 [Magnetococcales bacterium]|nr:hypothetical protein [Magnetococcales bacterium]
MNASPGLPHCLTWDQKMSEELLDIVIGGRSVRENLAAAVEGGFLIHHEDGTWEPLPDQPSTWLYKPLRQGPPCQLLISFFSYAYNYSAVPYGCQNCYKVKVVPRTLRQTYALIKIMDQIPCSSKCGPEMLSQHNSDLYGGFFYTFHLDEARDIYKLVRQAVNETPSLGADVPVKIKRGCTLFEVHCGPSDHYTFLPELPELERYLQSRFRPAAKSATPRPSKAKLMMQWIDLAFRIGDETYLDFTGGRRRFPKTVEYQ